METYQVVVVIVLLLLLVWYSSENFTNDHLWNRLAWKNGGSTRVILFGTSWCSVCKELRSNVWPRLENALPTLKFEEVDCDVSKETCSQYGIGTYPTILIVHNGVPEALRGSWRYEEILVELRQYA